MLVNVEAERVRNQFTKEDLSEKLNVSLKTYYNWINEERDVPSKKLKQMAIIFGTSMDYLMQGCVSVEGGGVREGVHKIKYDVEGNKTVMDLYYETGCVFRETYIDGKLISIECPKEKNKESLIASSIRKLILHVQNKRGGMKHEREEKPGYS